MWKKGVGSRPNKSITLVLYYSSDVMWDVRDVNEKIKGKREEEKKGMIPL